MTTEFLDLTLPTTETNWGELLNDNFTRIDTEFQTMHDNMVGSTGDWSDLSGASNLKDRLDAVISASGTSDDYTRATRSRIAATTTVAARLALIESLLLRSSQSHTALSSAPSSIARAIDDREISNRDLVMYDVGALNRWGSADIPNSVTLTGGDVTAGQDLGIVIGRRLYSIPARTVLIPSGSVVDGTYVLTAQTWDPGPTSIVNHLNLLGDSIDATCVSATVVSVAPGDLSGTPTTSDIFQVIDSTGAWATEDYRDYAISTYMGGSITLFGAFPSGVGRASITANIISTFLPPYVALRPYTVATRLNDMMDIALQPGCVIIGEVVISAGGTVLAFTPATELTNISRFIWLAGAAWGADSSKTISFTHLGIVKNITPMVRAVSGELIIPNEFTIGAIGEPTNEIYVGRRDTSYVCYSASLGVTLLDADVESWGVMVEL